MWIKFLHGAVNLNNISSIRIVGNIICFYAGTHDNVYELYCESNESAMHKLSELKYLLDGGK